MTVSPPNIVNVDSNRTHSEKKWSVGTLSYTISGLVILFVWLLWGDFAWAMKDRSVGAVLQVLFKKYDISDTVTGLLLSALPSGLGMLIGPIISYKSDRHRGRWGRRIPFLLIPTPVAFFSMIGLAFSPQIGVFFDHYLGQISPGANILVLYSFGIFWTLFELAAIVAGSVFNGLVNDVVPQAVIGRFYGLFRAFSLIAGIVFNYWIFGHAETYYVGIFIGIGALYGIGFSLMCLKVKEGKYPPIPEEDKSDSTFISKANEYLKESFGNAYYRHFAITATFLAITTLPINLYSVYYAKSIGMDLAMYGKCLAATYIISLVLAYPLGILADKFHPLRLTIAAILLYSIAMLFGGIFAKTTETFAVAFIAHGVLSGTYFTASASLGQKLLKRERFAQLGSAAGIISSLTTILLAPTVGKLLDFSDHNYRLTFYASSFFAALAFICLAILHKKFMKLGGVTNYVAP